jgi:putative ABC transport system permease protein
VFHRIRSTVKALWSRGSIEGELDEELRDHIERDTAHRVSLGAEPAEARRAALAKFGAIEATKDEVRDEHGITMLDDVARDVRHSIRRAVRNPQYTALVTLTMALGIGAATAVFSAVDGVLLKPLPYNDPDALVTMWQTRPAEGVERDDFAPATFLEVRERARTFSDVAAANPYGVTLSTPGRSEFVEAWQVSEGFLSMLGVTPHLGRNLETQDFTTGSAPVILLDYGFWQRRYGGDPAIVGQALSIDGSSSTVIGVMPRGFDLPEPADIWMPWVMRDDERAERFATYIRVYGRLAPGTTPDVAQAELEGIATTLQQEYPRSNTGIGFALVPLHEYLVGSTRPLLYTLVGAAAILLVVSLVNVAALHLTRLARGRRESAVRTALGATRRQLLRPLVAEAVVLAIIGGLVGLGLAWGGVRVLHALGPEDLRRLRDVAVDWRAVLAATTLALMTAVTLAVLPLRRLAGGHWGGRTVAGSRLSTRGRRAVVGAQLALGLVLLIGTTLLARSFLLVLAAERGYRSDHVLSFSTWVYDEYPDLSKRYEFVREVIVRLGALPGVQVASMGSALPLADDITGVQADVIPAGVAAGPGEERMARGTVVWPSYFEALGIALRRGRTFTEADDGRGEKVIVVNESFARRFFPGQEAVGALVQVGLMGRAIERRVVGVVADTRDVRLDAAPEPAAFIPWTQQPVASLTFVMRTTVDPATLAPAVTRVLYEIDPQLGIARISTLDALVEMRLGERRFLMVLIAAFALAAVAIATVGVFGVMSQAVTERGREIAVRMALGAAPRRIVSEFLAEAGWMTAVGLGVGLGIAMFATRAIARFLYGVAPVDGISVVLAMTFVVMLALVAAGLPSWRAARTNPARVLQEG